MAQKKRKNKKTGLDRFFEKIDKFFETIFQPLKWIIMLLFKFIGYILIGNKYSKAYWARRSDWRKTMHRLRSRTQKEIILESIIPSLNKQGFQRMPIPSWWGWDPYIQGYDYTLCRLVGEELQRICITTSYRRSYFQFHLSVFKLIPPIKNINELSRYDASLFFPEDCSAEARYDFIKYKLKSFSSEKVLAKRKKRLKRKFEKWIEGIDKLYIDWRKKHNPVMLDLKKKWEEQEKRRSENI